MRRVLKSRLAGTANEDIDNVNNAADNNSFFILIFHLCKCRLILFKLTHVGRITDGLDMVFGYSRYRYVQYVLDVGGKVDAIH